MFDYLVDDKNVCLYS